MKKLLILALLSLMTGCVTYYQPETALEDGVYYAGDDPSYVFNSGDYSGVVYYPWSSLDYFYLSYGAYYGYGFTYGYPYGWAYSPWGYPYVYHGYYSPWSLPMYRYSYWRPHYRGCSQGRHHNGCRDNGDDHGTGDDRYARDDNESQGKPGDEVEDYTQIRDGRSSKKSRTSGKRYFLTVPGGYAKGQAMVTRNSEKTKTGQSRPRPTAPVRAKTAGVAPSTTASAHRARAASAPAMSSRNSNSRSSYSSPRQHQSTGSKSSRRRDRD
jgi:hypothetical protein